MTLHALSATAAIARIEAGELTAEAVTEACVARLKALEPGLHAWAWFDESLPLAAARAADATRAAGGRVGPLAGVPFGIKDIFNTRDMPTQMGSALWEGFTPGNDARIVEELRYWGGVAMGKTHTAEFAVHAPGPTVNPHDRSRTPGTSSSGSAVAVAAGMVPFTLGSQTAGSTVRPASYCGIYGFKPSFGTVPRTGVLKTTDTLDHITWFARAVEDVRLIFDLARMRGANHPYIHRFLDQRTPKPADGPWTVALVRGPKWTDATEDSRAALDAFMDRVAKLDGLRVDELVLPAEFAEAHAIHQRLYSRALAYYFAEEAKQPERLSDSFRAMVEEGLRVSAEQYRDDVERQAELTRRMEQVLAPFDCAIGLSAADEAPIGLEKSDRPDDCLVWTMTGVPALGVPALKGPSKLPLGIQVVAPKYRDYDVMNFAERLCREGLVPEVQVAGDGIALDLAG